MTPKYINILFNKLKNYFGAKKSIISYVTESEENPARNHKNIINLHTVHKTTKN